jgi:hypothetical protein
VNNNRFAPLLGLTAGLQEVPMRFRGHARQWVDGLKGQPVLTNWASNDWRGAVLLDQNSNKKTVTIRIDGETQTIQGHRQPVLRRVSMSSVKLA